MAAPWRKVVSADRLKTSDSRSMTVLNRLECGHVLRFKGDAAWDAQYAEKRRCKECDRDPS